MDMSSVTLDELLNLDKIVRIVKETIEAMSLL